MPAATEEASFGPGLFSFLDDLRANNDRDWFAANKHRYEQELLEPALAFVEDFAPLLEQISPHFRADARPNGGSLFRIYRDTRFSKDKSPYKTNVGIHFRHERAKDAHAPGYYLHIGPDEVFAGGGIWHPDTKTITRIRDAIVAHPDGWRDATSEIALGNGDELKRVPSGYDKDHPLAEDLKRRNFAAIERLSEKEATGPDFLQRYARACERMAPTVGFLCRAVGVPF
jgi:uncharacterized protein (TIGR02453 family)